MSGRWTDRVVVGTSPAGVEWTTYRKPGDTDAKFAARVETCRRRLAEFHARHAVALVSVPLGAAALARLAEEVPCVEGAEAADPVDFGATRLRTTRRMVRALLDRVDGLADEWADLALAGYQGDHPGRAAMVERAARRCHATIITRLRRAL